MPAIYDPATTVPVAGGVARTPFSGNTIPVARMDPVARALLERYTLRDPILASFAQVTTVTKEFDVAEAVYREKSLNSTLSKNANAQTILSSRKVRNHP